MRTKRLKLSMHKIRGSYLSSGHTRRVALAVMHTRTGRSNRVKPIITELEMIIEEAVSLFCLTQQSKSALQSSVGSIELR